MKRLKKRIEENFDSKLQPPKLSPEMLEKWQQTIAENAEKGNEKKVPRFGLWQRLAVVFCCIAIILPCVLVPVLWPKDETYYGDDEVVYNQVELEYVKDYIDANFNQYSFIFQECEISETAGYFEKASNKLLAIQISAQYNDIPFTDVKLHLIIDSRYRLSEHNTFVKDAQLEIKDNYKLYTKTLESQFITEVYTLKECSNHKLYLKFNKVDESLLEKFL